MSPDGWVASDATKHSLEDQRPDWVSLVSVAIAVEDIAEFRRQYARICRQFTSEYGVKRRYPVIKSDDIGRWADDWEIAELLRGVVEYLLQIPVLDTIQITETSLHSRWVTVFSEDGQNESSIRSGEFVDRYLEPYYNLISIWEYLRKDDTRPRTHRNVMTDDFSGCVSPAWLDIGRAAERVRVVPKGDETYALLSMADLVMEYVKQEVDDWNEQAIYEQLKRNTPAKSGWVDSDAIHSDGQLEQIAPHRRVQVNTAIYYPNPTVYLDSGGMKSKTIQSLDFYDHALAFARANEGCVKFFDEHQDRQYLTGDDVVVCLDGNPGKYSYIERLNSSRVPEILGPDEAIDRLSDELDVYQSRR